MKEQPDWGWFWGEALKNPVSRLKWQLSTWYWARTCVKLLKGLDIKAYLELGAGSGLLAKNLAREFGFSVTLVDNNPKAKEVWKKISGVGDYILADFFEFSPKEKFDLVLSHGVIEHFANDKKRIEAIKVHARLSTKFVAIFVPKKSFWVKHFFHLPEERGFEKLHTFEELEKEMKEAGLKPLKRAQDLHILGILTSI